MFFLRNIVQLSIKRTQAIKHHIKFIQLFDNQLQFSKYNAEEEDIKFYLALPRQFHIYGQILLAVALPRLAGSLKIALATYQEHVMGLLIKYTFYLV